MPIYEAKVIRTVVETYRFKAPSRHYAKLGLRELDPFILGVPLSREDTGLEIVELTSTEGIDHAAD